MSAAKRSLACVSLCLIPAVVRADVIINSSLSLLQLQITPSAGLFEILSPFNASAFTQVFDSLGGFDQQFNSADDGATSAGSSTTLVTAMAVASAPALTESTTANLFLPEITASAGTTPGSPYGLLQGFFQITGTSGEVSVQLTAMLNESQSLSTTGSGLSASAEAIYSLLLPDISDSPLLFLDDPLSIAANASLSDSSSPALMATVTLMADTPYSLISQTDTEVKGTSSIPEPSSLILLFTSFSLGLLFVLRHRCHRRQIDHHRRATPKWFGLVCRQWTLGRRFVQLGTA